MNKLLHSSSTLLNFNINALIELFFFKFSKNVYFIVNNGLAFVYDEAYLSTLAQNI